MEWGWNPDTVVAVSTFIAMLAAIAAGIFAGISFVQMKRQAREAEQQTAHARRQVEESEKQTQEAREQSAAAAEQLAWARMDRERAQADSIAAWTEPDGDGVVVVVQNQSLTPIYDVRLAACLGTDNNPRHFYAARKTVIPPSRDNGHRIEPAAATHANFTDWRDKHPRNPLPRVDLIFRDKFGVEWRRRWDGLLERYESDRPFPHDWHRLDGSPLA